MPCSWSPSPHPLNFTQLTHLPCQLRETGDQDPFLLFSANLKRELAGEQLYRRALRESGAARLGSRAAGMGLWGGLGSVRRAEGSRESL